MKIRFLLTISLFSAFMSGQVFAEKLFELNDIYLVAPKNASQKPYLVTEPSFEVASFQFRVELGDYNFVFEHDFANSLHTDHSALFITYTHFNNRQEFMDHKGEKKQLTLGSLGSTPVKENDFSRIYSIKWLDRVYLNAIPQVSSPELTASYTFGVSTLVQQANRLEDLQKLRQKINAMTELPVNKNIQNKYSPALQANIRVFLDSVRSTLTQANHPKTEQLLKTLERRLYLIAPRVDALLALTNSDPSILLTDEDKKAIREEKAADRIKSLTELFLLIQKESIEAQARQDLKTVETLANESFRVLAVLYLTIGKTQGSIGEKEFYDSITSLGVFFSSLTIIPLLSLTPYEIENPWALAAYGFFASLSLYPLIKRDNPWAKLQYNKNSRPIYPFINNIEVRKTAQRLRENTFPVFLQSTASSGPFYEKDPEVIKLYHEIASFYYSKTPLLENLFKTIEQTSGLQLSKIMETSMCAHLLVPADK